MQGFRVFCSLLYAQYLGELQAHIKKPNTFDEKMNGMVGMVALRDTRELHLYTDSP